MSVSEFLLAPFKDQLPLKSTNKLNDETLEALEEFKEGSRERFKTLDELWKVLENPQS